MYNGIGLQTPRGSGTSGYIQANKFNLRRPPPTYAHEQNDLKKNAQKEVKPNEEILEHYKKRQIEVKLFELRMKLEESGVSEARIETKLKEEKKRIEKEIEDKNEKEKLKKLQPQENMDSHEVAKRKAERLAKLRDALGIPEDAVEGEAFDFELQAKKREEKKAEREEKERQRKELKELKEKEEKERLLKEKERFRKEREERKLKNKKEEDEKRLSKKRKEQESEIKDNRHSHEKSKNRHSKSRKKETSS